MRDPALESFVSPYTGIVRAIGSFLHAPDESRSSTFGCALADAGGLTGGSPPASTAGFGVRPDAARAAAIGEAVERYSATFVPLNQLVHATADELGSAAVEPSRFARFHERQYAWRGFPFAPARRDEPLLWAPAVALPDGDPVYVPAQLVYLAPASHGERPLGVPTSNGLACSPTWDGAVLGGLLELVERDAFMLAWYNRLSLPRLDWHGVREIEAVDERVFAPTRLGYTVIDLSAFFGIPVVLAIVRDPTGREPLFGIGAAAASDVGAAWQKAVCEAFVGYRWLGDTLAKGPDRIPASPSEIRDFDGHTLFYADHRRLQRLDFLEASRLRRSAADVEPLTGDAAAMIEAICSRLASQGVSAYAVDVAAPDVREAGLAVARVLSPELCALDVLGCAPHLGGRRMTHAAYEAGLLEQPLRYDDLNRDPHPFP